MNIYVKDKRTRALFKQNIRESVVACEQVLSGVWGGKEGGRDPSPLPLPTPGAPGELARRLSDLTRCGLCLWGQEASANHAVNCLFTFKLFRQFSSFRIILFSYF